MTLWSQRVPGFDYKSYTSRTMGQIEIRNTGNGNVAISVTNYGEGTGHDEFFDIAPNNRRVWTRTLLQAAYVYMYDNQDTLVVTVDPNGGELYYTVSS
ncbi:hypothetical protein L210DRAFT_2090661 [Boletus edulis BED1]|uniref:Uncharacterized protein n=1 Tax=Boletus edulis BED1 TaxID=1328754 RepID=A0AAD4G6E3_BOLED|nr:hypothetical protein L210DRAFT_2468663 [Boletus edulis BED1]KAF8441780.1 hypothetical protein L210DRAFT_2090661 [Boletus edulis BED1]